MLGERWLETSVFENDTVGNQCGGGLHGQMVDYVPEIGVFLGQQMDRAVCRSWEEGKNAVYMIEAHYIV